MSKTTTTSFFSWRGAFQIALAVAAFFMVDPYIRKLLSFVQEHCIAELSPKWFGAFVCLFVVCCFYILLGRYRNTYIPVQLRCGLLLLAAAYLYYRVSPCCYYRLSPEFYFWRISLGDWAVFRATWTDLLFLPWLYVMGGRGVLRYLSSNRRCMRMLRIFWIQRIWSKPIRLYKKTVKQIRRCARKLRVLWTRRIWSKLKRLCEQKAEVTRQEAKATSSSFSNPIERAEDDELGFNSKVCELAKELRGLELKERSTCYGIIAPWGYGKTSFLNLLSNELSADGIVVTFNPRSAKSVEHIQEDFFAKLAQELSQHYWGAGLLVSQYAEQIGILNHYSMVRLIADASRLFLTKGSKAAVSNAIEKIGKRLYIVLDDLDRLEGMELLETIKLIDINADFKNTVFLVACDKNYANDVLQVYLGINPSQGYLDKYIAREVHLREYINDKLTNIMAGYLRCEIEDGAIVTQKVVLDAWNRIAPYIVPHLGSVRHLKRYYGFFINDFKRVQDYVDSVDFFLLILLKYKDPGVYEAVKYKVCFVEDEPFLSPYQSNRWYCLSPWLPSDGDGDTVPSVKGGYERNLEQLELIRGAVLWKGAMEVLWLLFPNTTMLRELQLSSDFKDGYWRRSNTLHYSSIRYRQGFTSYFPDLEDEEREQWHQDVLLLIQSKDPKKVYRMLKGRYESLGGKKSLIRLLNSFLYSDLCPGEDRVTTLLYIAYLANKYPNSQLGNQLKHIMDRQVQVWYERGRRIVGSGEYKELVDRFFNKLEAMYPVFTSELLNEINKEQLENGSLIYTEDEINARLQRLQCLLKKPSGVMPLGKYHLPSLVSHGASLSQMKIYYVRHLQATQRRVHVARGRRGIHALRYKLN